MNIVWCGCCVFLCYLLFLLVFSLSSVGKSLNVVWNQLVVAMYQKSAGSVLGIIVSFVMLIFLLPMPLHRACLAFWCAVQCSIKCYTVSSPCWHAGQIGKSTFPMWCKCLARGTCPVLSCDSVLASFPSRLQFPTCPIGLRLDCSESKLIPVESEWSPSSSSRVPVVPVEFQWSPSEVWVKSEWSPNGIWVEMPKGSTSCNAVVW